MAYQCAFDLAERVGFEPTSYAVDFSIFRVDNRLEVNILPPIEAGDFLQNQVKIWEIRSFCIELGRR